MERRTFVRSSLTLGAVGVGGVGPLRQLLLASPRELRGEAARWPSDQAVTLRLSSNENPLGLSPAARRAVIDGIAEANRYPGASRRRLLARLASYHSLPVERMFLGAGSTEVLRMAVQAWSAPGARLVVASPTFEDVPYYSGPFPYRLETVPLTAEYAHDVGRMREIAEASSDPTVVYLCNPNNPTGTLTASADIDAWIGVAPERVKFLVDEAYFDFVSDPAYWSAIPWTAQRTNVVVVRTFSKIFGMAGVRLGYGIAHPLTAQRARRFRTRNNANHLAAVAGLASLDDAEHIRRSLDANRRAAAVLTGCLDELELEHLPSHTNFVMHRIRGDLRTYIRRMGDNGIRVGRPFPPMLSYNRLSLGLPEEMERFAETLRSFHQRRWV